MTDDLSNDPEYQQLLERERARVRGKKAPSVKTLAHEVTSLGDFALAMAWVLGALGVLGGIALAADGIIAALGLIPVSLGQAALLALAAKYAQLRAAEARQALG